MPGQPGGHPAGERLVLRTAIGQYPHTAAMRDGAVASDLVAFDFVDVPAIHQAFAPMVREQRFDVSEIAIATCSPLRLGKLLIGRADNGLRPDDGQALPR